MDDLASALVDGELAIDGHWARLLIEHGCVKLNDELVYAPNAKVAIGDKVSKVGFLMKIGKRRWLKGIYDV